ncbi:hypothetical protein JCM16774_1477 [Pseudoleptotrichia goodfellowii]|uniref:Alpha 1,4-glycosyltransferase domain-containing protein n=1 Tax=Pseudoleptotrichia goodfellowii TaxID=157692 RepID=A0A510JER8_9FUSO|nr:glycosyltransferase [Pseudoleptotrichia goodfellowii]BBM36533.1 hypothetical protein JCM16774_1477 [Pseudoleptotrichia goodfellowii]
MIEKKIYYVWIGNAKKPDIFYKCLKSWQENLPDFQITEINEKNFDMETHLKKNKFFRECYERKLWAYVSDYIRVHYMYEHSGIYVDTDMEIIKDITPLITKENMKFFIGYEDEKHISVGIFGTDRHNEVLKDLTEFYEKEIWEKPLWTIPKIFTYIFEKKYGLTDKRENTLKKGEITIYPKEYFYPYGFKEKYTPQCITENTYGIHWWNDSWTSLKARLFLETKHLTGFSKIVKKMRIVARYYIKERRIGS